MSKINLLSSKIYNRIAAGEVVERPSSVVKELVENSIDAGANNVQIDISGGGIASIVITDNGSGIEKSELKKALLPHATSKISKLSDLDNITSLGFRGEALASIASVSKIKIVSKPKEQQLGASISAVGGDIEEVVDCGAVDGTEITVNNLFFNTPVREKFLKTERSEENEISSTVLRFILGNPTIAFKYTADGKVIYQSFGDGFESAMACVYGIDTINQCFSINTERNGLTVNGYIGKHHFTKGNRSYQTVFLNGRYVVNQTISSAISNAYSSYLMKRQYPFFVLNVTVPTEIVDVNVHPNKLDVRFSNNQIIYGTIYSIVSKVLDGSSEALNIVLKDKINSNDIKLDYVTQNNVNSAKISDYFADVKIAKAKEREPIVFHDGGAKAISESKQEIKEKTSEVIDIFAENKAFLEKLEKEKREREQKIALQSAINIDKDLRVIGQALNTFLIMEDGDDLYFIDQHAAHERLIFDKLRGAINSGEVLSQQLLLPFVLSVNNVEYEFLQGKISALNKMGVEISEFGKNSFKISAIPSFIADMNIKKFFDLILSEIESLKNMEVEDILFDRLAQKACKAAIKSGDKLSESEIKILTEEIKKDLGLKCPHGRPVVIKISRMEIDKWFKRIV